MTVLVLDYITTNQLRVSTHQHTYAFRNHGQKFNYSYLNLFPLHYLPVNIECYSAIFLNFTLLDRRYKRSTFKKIIKLLTDKLNLYSGPIYAFPQDEFINMDLLNELFGNIGVTKIFSVANEFNWPILYPDFSDRISRVLTGYLSNVISRKKYPNYTERNTDIFYRTHIGKTWGKFNAQKQNIGNAALRISKVCNFEADIKFGIDNFLVGKLWLDQLKDSRITLGIEGGADFLNWDGSLNPENNYDAQRGYDKIEIKALSPRHFESMQCGCVQVLVEGCYNGILLPGRHYIPVKEDLSDLDDAIIKALDPTVWSKINQNCQKDILHNEKYYYSSYVKKIEGALTADLKDHKEECINSYIQALAHISKVSCYLIDFIRYIRSNAKKNIN